MKTDTWKIALVTALPRWRFQAKSTVFLSKIQTAGENGAVVAPIGVKIENLLETEH
jgi:hypothetical protein